MAAAYGEGKGRFGEDMAAGCGEEMAGYGGEDGAGLEEGIFGYGGAKELAPREGRASHVGSERVHKIFLAKSKLYIYGKFFLLPGSNYSFALTCTRVGFCWSTTNGFILDLTR